MQVGELTGFLSYVLQILNSLMMLSNVFMMLTRSMASGTRILEVLNEKVEITEEKARPVSVKKGAIRFDHVFFQYSKNAEASVLSDICLKMCIRDRVYGGMLNAIGLQNPGIDVFIERDLAFRCV